MTRALGVLGAIILLGNAVGSLLEGNQLPLLTTTFVLIGGFVALAVAEPAVHPGRRFMLGALAGVSLLRMALMTFISGSSMGPANLGLIVGEALGEWVIVGGAGALLVRALPFVRRAAPPT